MIVLELTPKRTNISPLKLTITFNTENVYLENRVGDSIEIDWEQANNLRDALIKHLPKE